MLLNSLRITLSIASRENRHARNGIIRSRCTVIKIAPSYLQSPRGHRPFSVAAWRSLAPVWSGYCNFLPCSFRTRSASKGVAQADAPPPRGRRTEGSSLMRGGLMARNFTPVGSTAERYPGILSLGKPSNETVPAPPWHYSLTDIAYHPLQGYRCMIWGTAARRYRYALSFFTCIVP